MLLEKGGGISILDLKCGMKLAWKTLCVEVLMLATMRIYFAVTTVHVVADIRYILSQFSFYYQLQTLLSFSGIHD
jgi:hypothetical protein